MTTTYEKLIQRFDSESNKLASICNIISLQVSFIGLIIKTIDVWMTSQRALRTIRKVEKISCAGCNGACGFPQKKGLQNIVDGLRHCVNNMATRPSIPLVVPIFNNLLDQFEDKLEDYWITTDKESKDLMTSLAQKISQKNVSR